MKWKLTQDFPKVSGIYLLDCPLNGIGKERFDIHSKMDEISWKTRKARWLDESESEPLYTEKEVLMFSEYLFFGYQNVITVKAPRNYISQKDVITLEEPELKYYTQEEIFKFWKSIFIPNKI